jgi:hypothetical protein
MLSKSGKHVRGTLVRRRGKRHQTYHCCLKKKRDVTGGGRTLRIAKCATPHTASRTIAYCKLNITYVLFCCLHYVILHACLLLPAAVVLLIAEVTDGRTEPKGAYLEYLTGGY